MTKKLKSIKNMEIFKYKINKESMSLSETNENEIIEVIQNMEQKKSPGIDGIKSDTLQDIRYELATVLTYLVYKAFRDGTFPDVLKIAEIRPMYESGNKLNV